MWALDSRSLQNTVDPDNRKKVQRLFHARCEVITAWKHLIWWSSQLGKYTFSTDKCRCVSKLHVHAGNTRKFDKFHCCQKRSCSINVRKFRETYRVSYNWQTSRKSCKSYLYHGTKVQFICAHFRAYRDVVEEEIIFEQTSDYFLFHTLRLSITFLL